MLASLGFLASAAIFVCAFAGFCWLFLGFWRPRRILCVLLLAFLRLLASVAPADPKIQKMKNMKKYKNEDLQKLIILEGFMQNGLQNRNQRNFLRIKSCVRIDFRYFLLKKYDF